MGYDLTIYLNENEDAESIEKVLMDMLRMYIDEHINCLLEVNTEKHD